VSDRFAPLTPDDFAAGRALASDRLRSSVTVALSADERARLGQLQADPANIDVSTTGQDGAFVSIAIDADGVTLSLSIVSDPHAEIFVDWLDESSAFKTLERLEGFELLVLDRQPENLAERYSGKRPIWPTQARTVERERIALEEIEPDAVEALLTSCRSLEWRWERVGFVLTTTRSPELCAERGDQFLVELVEDVQALLPIVGRINRLARQAKGSKAPALERASWRKPG
jgi:hypothetical protein